jgi:hypothetical protein
MSETRNHLLPLAIVCWLELPEQDGSTRRLRVPVTDVNLTFQPNVMPEAVFGLPVGLNARTGVRSPAYDLVKRASSRLPIRLRAKLAGQFRDANRVVRRYPDRIHTLWQGYTTGVTHGAAASGLNYALSSTHWLGDLDSGTLASGDLVSGDFGDMTVSVAKDTEGGGTTLISAGSVAGSASLSGQVDMWDVVRTMMTMVMTPRGQGMGRLGRGSLLQSATEAVESLALPALELGNAKAIATMKLFNDAKVLNPGSLLINDFSGHNPRLSEQLAEVICGGLGGTTAWQKLVTLAQLLHFRLIPTVDSLAVVPYMPVYAHAPWRSIWAGDTLRVDGQAATPARLSAVAMVGTPWNSTRYDQSDPPRANGFWSSGRVGKVKLVRNPDWLFSGQWFNPDKLSSSPDEALTERGATRGNDYARAIWADDCYKGRVMSVHTPLRLDIAPGCPVAVNGLDVSTRAGESRLLGMVQAVRIMMSAGGRDARTELTISHLRTIADDNLAPTAHPLYDNLWPGTELLRLDSPGSAWKYQKEPSR